MQKLESILQSFAVYYATRHKDIGTNLFSVQHSLQDPFTQAEYLETLFLFTLHFERSSVQALMTLNNIIESGAKTIAKAALILLLTPFVHEQSVFDYVLGNRTKYLNKKDTALLYEAFDFLVLYRYQKGMDLKRTTLTANIIKILEK